MPIENERKYVLEMSFYKDLDKIVWDREARYLYSRIIEQGYLFGDNDMCARIRRAGNHHAFCFKKQVAGQTIEIEKQISESDFEALWPSTTNRLRKVRHFIRSFVPKGEWEDGNGKIHRNCWEVDVFLDDQNEPYFVMAEHEMPEDRSEPEYLPTQISNYMKYKVPRNRQYEFSSLRLGDKEYALSLDIPKE